MLPSNARSQARRIVHIALRPLPRPLRASAFAFSEFTSRVIARAVNSPVWIVQDRADQAAALSARGAHYRDDFLVSHGSHDTNRPYQVILISYGAIIMIIADLSQIAGRTYPARRRTQNLVGGVSPIQATNFSMGHVTLEPNGGQVPWHNQEQEEIYFIVEGTGEMCLGEERMAVTTGQAVYIPPTRLPPADQHRRARRMRMIYCYGPAGDVAHWRQELDGTLPQGGRGCPRAARGRPAAVHREAQG